MRTAILTTLLVLPLVAQTPAPQAPEHPLTLAQLRDLMEATSVLELMGNLNRKQLVAQQQELPVWWPNPVWQATVEAMNSVDMATVYLPFYQKCYSGTEARMFIHLFNTPEGHAYARRMVGLGVGKREEGESATQARTESMKTDAGLDPAAIRRLNAEDQAEAKRVFTSPRAAEISACVGKGLTEGEAEFQAQQMTAVKAVMQAHMDEIRAAKTKYLAEHPAAVSPQ